MKTTKLIIGVALVHCLFTLFVSPMGWEYLYSWDSPRWFRAVWACAFSLPLLIVFAHGWFPAWVVTFVLIPLNSLLLSWMVIKPIQSFLDFRRTGQRRDLAWAVVGSGFSLVLVGIIAAVWVPPNIVSAKEAAIHNMQQIDQWTQQIDQWTRTNITQRP